MLRARRFLKAYGWCLVVIASWAQPSYAQDRWSRADSAVARLAPSAFTDLPESIASDLLRRGCSIPQTYGQSKPHNVVRGAFTAPGRIDLAVLCSVGRISTILVYREASAGVFDSLSTSPDVEWLQGMGGADISYSRAIRTARPEYIRRQHAHYGGKTLPDPLDQDGIEHSFEGKASVILYFLAGRWLRLQGAD